MHKRLAIPVLLAFALGCDGNPVGPPGSIRVDIITTGVDRDASYEVGVAGATHAVTGTPATVTIGGVRAGSHSVTLQGLQSNCTATGGDARTVRVRSNSTAQTNFTVSCTALTGAMKIVSNVSGTEFDPNGVTVQIGTGAVINLNTSDSVVVAGLSAGDHTVTMGGLAPNCTVAPNPRTVRVVAGGLARDTVRAVFAMTCTTTTGTVRVVAQTIGVSVDPNGYSVTIDGAPLFAALPTNGELSSSGIAPGSHSFQLGGIAPNCTVSGANPRVGTVVAGATLQIAFGVICSQVTSSARIVATTTGTVLDPDGYTVRIDGVSPTFALPINGDVTATGLTLGTRQFSLEGVAANCVVAGSNPQSATVVQSVTIEVRFAVSCGPFARLEVSASTAGPDPDRNGYRIRVSASAEEIDPSEKTVAATGTVVFEPLPARTYTVSLLDLAPNCEVTGTASRTVVASGGTTSISFAVTCTVLERIAFAADFGGAGGGVTNFDIYTSKADGTDMQRLTLDPGLDVEPTWSATGGIAFRSNRNGNEDIYLMNEAGGTATRLTTHAGRDHSPAWSPDGRRIAFVSDRDGDAEIYVMDADGGNVRRVTNMAGVNIDPAWSPDGRIAFTSGSCTGFGCSGNLYVIDADGQRLTRLTEGGNDGQPAWSADGTTIAFSRLTQCGYYYYYTCGRAIMVMAASGGNVRQFTRYSSDESDPAWSASGSRLLVALAMCNYYYSCGSPEGIRVVRPDGSDPVDVIIGAAINPVWRR